MFASIGRSLKERFGAPGIIATLALCLAVGGAGAWAAKGGFKITKLNQIKPSVQKQLKGQAGPPGPAGPSTSGPAGAKGDNGSNGAPGQGAETVSFPGSKTIGSVTCTEGGLEVKSASATTLVCNGKKGLNSTPPDILPINKTETGTWSMVLDAEGKGLAPISFAIPVKEAATSVKVKIVDIAASAPEECENEEHAGTADAENPEADSGFLCIYAAAPSGLFGSGINPLGAFKVGGTEFGFSRSGAVIAVAGGTAGAYGQGSWAVAGF